jgi:phage tail protein X
MAISAFSRYADNTVTPIQDREGVTRSTIVIEPPDQAATYSISTYTWQNGDRIDYLAYSAYGDETQWWRIANANPEILFWSDIPNGAQIRVPNA